ncbi:MFS transporter [Streptomyces bangladeshensis]|uniref:Major facilitator superfamily (MFS) profile domain-containing protein n=1 Tax=Streptomyces bangladeshensis TaxID=295352 RepID=A0ABN3BEK3_9ACTN
MTHPGPGPDRPGGDRWLPVAVAGLLSFVAMLDMNIVNVALADIADGLHVSAATAQWAVLGYQLPVVALLLPAGRWLDGTGTRAAVLAATAGFGLSSALAAAAPWAPWLIAARLAQGACGAVLFVLMPVLALGSVRPGMRGRAMSVPATLGPLGAVTGPAVGGLLLDHLGWRAVFLVKLPVCALALALAWRALPRDGGLRPPDRRSVADALLVASGVAVLLLALTLAADGPAWSLLAVAALPPLWWWLRGPGGRPVTGVLRAARLLRAHAAVLALAAGFAAMHYVVALHLQRDADVSATTTGLTLLAFPLGMAAAGPLGGRLADLPRSGRRPRASAPARLADLLRSRLRLRAGVSVRPRPVAGTGAEGLARPGLRPRAHASARPRPATGTGAGDFLRSRLRLRAGVSVRPRPVAGTGAEGLARPGSRPRAHASARTRPVAVTGALVTAVGLVLLVPLDTGWSPADVAWRLALAGVGMGLNGGPAQALVLGAAPADRAATVGATVQLARGLGFTLGPALATAAGAGTGVTAGLVLAATAACLAVPLLALPGRRPSAVPGTSTDAAPAARP